MNKPTDYPIKTNRSSQSKETKASDITYAVLRDRVAAKKPVTDEMIRTARTKLDTAHVSKMKKGTSTGKFTLSGIRNRFK